MRIFSTTLFLLLATVSLPAEDWPQWRGPLGNGVTPERNLPVRWSKTENLAWRVPLTGVGVSSPVVFGDRVFVTSQIGRGSRREGDHPSLVQGEASKTAGERALATSPSTQQADEAVTFVVTAYQSSDGRQLWQYRLPAQGELVPVHDKHNLATPSPVTDGKMVYALFGTGQLVALDMQGQPAWTHHLGTEYSPFIILWGHSSSPALHEDLLILLCFQEPSSYLLALDKTSGKMRWKTDHNPKVLSYSTPIVVRGEGGAEIIVNSSEGLEAYDPAKGTLLWRVPETNRFAVPVPTSNDGTIYTTRGYRSSPYLAVRLGGRGDVSATHVQWKVATGGPYISSLVYYEGLLYMASELGIVTVIDASNGERVWRDRLDGIFTASPVAGDGKIYLVSETGETIVLRAGKTPDVLARNKLDDHLVASPAISGGRIFLRGDDHLIAIAPTAGPSADNQ